MFPLLSVFCQILAASLTHCHKISSDEGHPLSLKVFVAGRNRLENDGATALAQAFKVQDLLKDELYSSLHESTVESNVYITPFIFFPS